MSKNTRLFLIILSVLAMVIVAACGGGNNGGSNSNDTPSQSQGGGDTTTPSNGGSGGDADRGPIPIEIMVPQHTAEIPDETIKNMIEEMTGYKITYQWVPDGTYAERLSAAFGTGQLPQATYQRNASSFPLFKEAMKDGQFWEIGPLLSEFPNLSRLNPDILDNTRVDGKLYTLYLGRPLSRQGIIYRADWAEELGVKEPTNIQEFEDMLRAFTEGKLGGPDTIGLTDRADLIFGAFKTISSWFGTPNNWGEKDGQLLPEFMFEEYYDTMDFFRKMYDNGWINKDFPVASKDEQQDLLINGTAGVYVGAMTDIDGLTRKTLEVNPDARLDVTAHLGKWNWAIAGYGNVVMFPKSAIKDEDELRDVLGFFDKTMTPEVATLMRWGIEGEHYEREGDYAKRDPEVHTTDILDRYVKGYTDQLIGEEITNGALLPLHTLPARVKAESLIANELLNNLVFDPTVVLDSETALEDGPRLQTIINDATYNYMIGDIDRAGFEQAVQNWLNAGGQNMINEFNADWKK